MRDYNYELDGHASAYNEEKVYFMSICISMYSS